MTVDELRAIQDREDLRDRHVVELRESGFTLAHTDHERIRARVAGVRLEDCPVYGWLTDAGIDELGGIEPGVYLLRRRFADEGSGYVFESLTANAAQTTRR
jgi:hypothetical protein